METKFTKGRLKVVMDGTLTGVWAAVVEECITPEGEDFERELGRSDTTHVRRESAYFDEPWGDFTEAPEEYEIEPCGDEMIANAHLWAASPDLYEALAEAVDETCLWGADHPLRLKWKAVLARARGEQP